jgi:hypothetical protein
MPATPGRMRRFVGAIRDIASTTDKELLVPNQNRIGQIDPTYTGVGQPSVLLDTDEIISAKQYQILDSTYWPAPGDMVILTPVGRTYVIIGALNATVRVGEVMMSTAYFTPAGFLLCDGSAVSKIAYGRLYSKMTGNGTITAPFGETAGSTGTFNLPPSHDGNSRFPRAVNPISTNPSGGSVNHSHGLSASGWAKLSNPTTGMAIKVVSGVPSYTGDFLYAVTRAADGASRTAGVELGGATDSFSSDPMYVSFKFFIRY